MEDGLIYVLCEDVAQDLARNGVKYGMVDVFVVHLKLYSINGSEPDPHKGSTNDVDKNQQGSPSVEEIVLTNIPVSQSQDESEVDGRDTTNFGAAEHKNAADQGLENLHCTEEIVETNLDL